MENYFKFVVWQELCFRCDFKLPAKLAVILCRSFFQISSSYSHYPCWVAVWSNHISLSFPLNDYLYTYRNKFLVFLKAPMCACCGIYNFELHLFISIFITGLFKNMQMLEFKSCLHSYVFRSVPSISVMITSNEPWNTETHKTDQNPLITITNHDLLKPLK